MVNSDSNSEINEDSSYTEQVAAVPEVVPKDPLIGFFAIGLAVNIIMITVFFIWARKQWKKSSKLNE